jgi:uncharacterized protein
VEARLTMNVSKRRPAALSLSSTEARMAMLGALGLCPGPDDHAAVSDVLTRLGAVQLDAIAVLARSHELIAYSRLGRIGRQAVESCFWGQRPAAAFEAWAHAACVLPVDAWPYFGFRRRQKLHAGPDGIDRRALENVRARLRAGPVTTAGLDDAPASGRFDTRGPKKRAAEWLCSAGEAVCTNRRSWQRVYDLPERTLPASVLGREMPEDECIRYLVERAVAAMGVSTRHDIADYYRLTLRQVDRALAQSDVIAVNVAGWEETAWASPELMAATWPTAPSRTTLLSPFDQVVWDRNRMRRVFGFTLLLEAYRPKGKRVNGYFTMPLLCHGKLVGWVDPARDSKTLVARNLHLNDLAYVPAMCEALFEAASWVGCDNVVIERTTEEWILAPLSNAIGNFT